MLTNRIALIGYRGSGKSAVGRELAAHLGYPLADSDDAIEASASKSIAQIFDQEGEPEFRRLEEIAISKLLESSPLVLALGGGAVLSDVTQSRLRSKTFVIWLRAPAAVLTERIRGDEATATRRPSLTALDAQAEVQALLEEREPIYEELANASVDTAQRAIQEVVGEILQLLSHPDPL